MRSSTSSLVRTLLFVLMALVATAPAWAQASLTLRKIKETGVISIGYRDGSIPFSYLDGTQQPVGYAMDICHLIVEEVQRRLKIENLQIKLTPVNSSTRIPMVANNTIDLECGTTSNTLERQNMVAFTVTTFLASSRLATKRGSNISDFEDLQGKTVVSTAGTTSMARLVELNQQGSLRMRILAGKDHAQSFRLLETDRAAVFVMDDVLLYSMIAMSREPSGYIVTGKPLSVEPYSIVLRKDDPEFKKLADDTIVKLFRNGGIHALHRKWFQTPIPPRGINLEQPMSEAFKKLIHQPKDSGNPADYISSSN
ncbi:MAG: transporter substrate-binding domain-containing protein [Pseudomonadota bacterium]